MESVENIRAVPATTSVDSREDEANTRDLPGSIPEADIRISNHGSRSIDNGWMVSFPIPGQSRKRQVWFTRRCLLTRIANLEEQDLDTQVEQRALARLNAAIAGEKADLSGALERLKATCDAATPGPWHTAAMFVRGESDEDLLQVTDKWGYSGEPRDWEPDAEFIAASRTALPALIEFARTLHEKDIGRCECGVGKCKVSRDAWAKLAAALEGK